MIEKEYVESYLDYLANITDEQLSELMSHHLKLFPECMIIDVERFGLTFRQK